LVDISDHDFGPEILIQNNEGFSMSQVAEPEISYRDKLNAKWVISIFLRTWPFIRPMLRHLIGFVVISGIVALIAAGISLILIGIATAGVLAGQPIGGFAAAMFSLDPTIFVDAEELGVDARRDLLWPTLILAIILSVVVIPSGAMLYYYSIWIFQQINQLMRVQLIERLHAQSLSYHANSRTGDAIYRVYQDSAMVTAIIRSIFLDPLMFLGRYFVGVFIVAAFDPLLALILGVVVAPLLGLGYYYSDRLRTRFRIAREENSSLTSWIQESIQGIRVIKATAGESLRSEGFNERSNNALNAAFHSRVTLTIFGILGFSIVGLAVLATESLAAIWSNIGAETFAQTILLGFGFAIWNFGTFSAVNSRSNDGLGAIRALISLWGRAQDMAMGLGRVFEILDLKPDIEDAPDAILLPTFSKEVRFENVAFSYRDNRSVLSDINIVAPRGTVTAIVGPTGTGKSTLMSLLLRLADPDKGRVTIDGLDLRQVTVDSLRANIAIATQENILFSDTVTENIRYAVPGASSVQVTDAAVVACADEFIDEMPLKYDSFLGERATKLSSGQRQRIVIARAIIKDAPILILDEPTAALDAETELRVLDSIKRWGEKRSIFLITHRLSTIRQADMVVYLRDGIVLAQGNHDELIAHTSAYREFIEAETGQQA
jgi:ATP-binding cassette subfamily B protein